MCEGSAHGSHGGGLALQKHSAFIFEKDPSRARKVGLEIYCGRHPWCGRVSTLRGGSRSLSFLRSSEAQTASSFPTRSTSSFSLVLRYISFFSVRRSTSPKFSYTSPSVPHTRAPNAVATTTASSCDRVGSLEIAWSVVDSRAFESVAATISVRKHSVGKIRSSYLTSVGTVLVRLASELEGVVMVAYLGS